MATQPVDDATGPQMTELAPIPNTYSVDMRWPMAFVLAVVTILAYQPVWHAGFIWDDEIYITDNHMFKAGNTIYRLWLTTESADYWPLTASVEWLEWRLWGDHAVGYHLVNVFLHIANAILIWMVLQRLKIPGAWLAALVFAIHPVNAATVAWVSEQNNTLSMFFYLVTIILYLRFDNERSWPWYGLSLVAFLLALLSKSSVVMLPVVLLGCVWWSRGAVGRRDLLRSLPFFILSAAMAMVTIWFQSRRVLEGQTIQVGGFLSRLATASQALWFYMYKALLPYRLSAVYPQLKVDWPGGLSHLPGVALVACLVFFWRNRKHWGRPLLFGLSYFVVTLFPVLGFFDQTFHRYSLIADHWQYAAIVAPIALVVAGGVAIYRRCCERGRFIAVLMSVAVSVVLGATTWTRAGVYESSQSLWRDTVEKNPNAWVAHFNLGNALLREGRIQDAITHYEHAVRLKPDYVEGHINLAFVLLQVRRVDDAIGHLEQAVRINPDSVEGRYDLGDAYLQVGRVREAIGHLEQAVRLKPDYLQAHVNLGFAFAQRGRFDEAARHWEAALRLDPNNQNAQLGLEQVRRIRLSNAPTP